MDWSYSYNKLSSKIGIWEDDNITKNNTGDVVKGGRAQGVHMTTTPFENHDELLKSRFWLKYDY